MKFPMNAASANLHFMQDSRRHSENHLDILHYTAGIQRCELIPPRAMSWYLLALEKVIKGLHLPCRDGTELVFFFTFLVLKRTFKVPDSSVKSSVEDWLHTLFGKQTNEKQLSEKTIIMDRAKYNCVCKRVVQVRNV